MGTLEKVWVLICLPFLWFMRTNMISEKNKYRLLALAVLYLCLTDHP